MSTSRRLNILSKDEIKDLYSIPSLTDEDRKELFAISDAEHDIITKLPNELSKINFILQLGYFRVKQFFFIFTFQKVRGDVWYIINNYFPGSGFPKKQVSKFLHYENQKKLLEQTKYRSIKASDKSQLVKQAKYFTKLDLYPRFIFDELLKFCQQSYLTMPSYTTMQLVISNALQEERTRLTDKLDSLLNKEAKLALEKLLKCEESFYVLTLLKKDPKDFSTGEIRKEVLKHRDLLDIYQHTKEVLPALEISPKNIEYYANLANLYKPNKLKSFGKKISQLYLLCYVHEKLFKVNDNLITFFLHKTQKYYKEAEQYSNEQMLIDDNEVIERLNKASKLAKLYINQSITDINLRQAAFEIVPKDEMKQFAKDLTKRSNKKTYFLWQSIKNQSSSIKINLRQVFQVVDFKCNSDNDLLPAIKFLKTHIAKNSNFKTYKFDDIPIKFIPLNLQHFIIETVDDSTDKRRKTKVINGDCYEYMLYLQLQRQLGSGQVFIKESINYRTLEDELIPHDLWIKNQDKILKELNLAAIKIPIITILKELDLALTKRYKEINNNITTGQNKHIKLIYNKAQPIKWKLPYKKQEECVNNPFYEKLPSLNVGDIIHYVMNVTQLNKAFGSALPRYAKFTISENNIVACAIANGTGIGVNKMSEISDIKSSELETTERSYFSISNLRKASDIVVNKLPELTTFGFYTLSEYGIHASVDGQKVETKSHVIKARYSKKYFACGKGVVSYSLVANHAPINGRVIGANEHESYYLLDIIYNNTSEIEIATVSGDMHSINRVNFALLHLFGYRFMPRFTQLQQKVQANLVSFQDPEELKDLIIKPKSRVNENLIIKEWDNILRIIASLALKKTTQATIIKKLSSYKRANPTLKALFEFDKIISSLYLLDYIDDYEVRSNVPALIKSRRSPASINFSYTQGG